MRSAFKEALLFLLLLVPGLAQAHAGHAEEGSVAHGVQHASWLGIAVLAGIVVMLVLFSAWSRDDDKP